LLLRAESPVNAVASPTKLGEYLASGLPVITTPYAGDASSVVAETGTGFVIDIPFRTESLRDLCDWLSEITVSRKEYFQRCIEAAQEYRDVSLMQQRIGLLYDKLLTRGSRETRSVR
jgi:hypothetical protein